MSIPLVLSLSLIQMSTQHSDPVQVAKRVVLTGIVRTVDKKPWVGARVVLHSRTVQGLPGIGTVDRLEVITNERGKFTAKVLDHSQYLVWAVSQDPGTTYRTTYPLDDVHVGRSVRLVERRNKFVQVKISVDPGKHWKDRAPFSIKLTNERALHVVLSTTSLVGMRRHVLEHELASSGVTTLPRLAWDEVMVEVFDKSGILLSKHSVELAERARRLALDNVADIVRANLIARLKDFHLVSRDKIESLERQRFVISDPETRTFKIVANEKGGKALSHAKLYQVVRGHNVLLAEADTDGVVSLTLPERMIGRGSQFPAGQEVTEIVRVKGYAQSPLAPEMKHAPLAIPQKRTESRVLELVLKRPASAKGRLLLHGKPLAGADLLFVNKSSDDWNVDHWLHCSRRLHTDKQGRFVIEGLPRRPESCALLCVLPDSLLVREKGKPALHRLALIAFCSFDRDKDLGNIELSTMARFSVNAKLSDGTPSRDAAVLLFTGKSNTLSLRKAFSILQLATDRRGRAAMLLPQVEGLEILVYDKTGYSYAELPALAADAEMDFTIEPIAYQGVIKDKHGKAVPGVVVAPTFVTNSNNKAVVSSRSMLAMNYRVLSDDDGHFELWYPHPGSSLDLQVVQAVGGVFFASIEMKIDVSAGRDKRYAIELDPDAVLKLKIVRQILGTAPVEDGVGHKKGKSEKKR